MQALEKSKEQVPKQSPTVFKFEQTDATASITKKEVTLSDKSTQTDHDHKYTKVQDEECQTDEVQKLSFACQTTDQVYLTQDSNASTQDGLPFDMEYKEVCLNQSMQPSDA